MLFFGLAVLVLNYDNEQNNHSPIAGTVLGVNTAPSYIEYEGTSYRLKPNLETFLIMGVDKYLDTELGPVQGIYEQGDVLLLAVIDRSARTYSILQINRDTMTPVRLLTNSGVHFRTDVQQIALAHAYGGGGAVGCRNTVEAVSTLLGKVKINHYLSLTMDGVMMLNDAVGGVTLEVMDTIGDVMNAGDTVTLYGADALAYVRARKDIENPTNIRRMERQLQYFEAFRAQLDRCIAEDPDFVLHVLTNVNEFMVSDCTVELLSSTFNEIHEFEMQGYRHLAGDAIPGTRYMEYYVSRETRIESIIDLFYEEA